MRLHEGFAGVTTDHLYQRCPALQRLKAGPTPLRYPDMRFGKRYVIPVDPLEANICGWCRRVWKAKQ